MVILLNGKVIGRTQIDRSSLFVHVGSPCLLTAYCFRLTASKIR